MVIILHLVTDFFVVEASGKPRFAFPILFMLRLSFPVNRQNLLADGCKAVSKFLPYLFFGEFYMRFYFLPERFNFDDESIVRLLHMGQHIYKI